MEPIDGSREELERGAQALREEGKTIDLEVQYNPANPAVVSNEIVTYVPRCRYWIAGFFIFFCVMELLIPLLAGNIPEYGVSDHRVGRPTEHAST